MALSPSIYLRGLEQRAAELAKQRERERLDYENRHSGYESMARVQKALADTEATRLDNLLRRAEAEGKMAYQKGEEVPEFTDEALTRRAKETYDALQMQAEEEREKARAEEAKFRGREAFKSRMAREEEDLKAVDRATEKSVEAWRKALADQTAFERQKILEGIKKDAKKGKKAGEEAKGLVKMLEKRSTDIFADYPELWTAAEGKLRALRATRTDEQALAEWAVSPEFEALGPALGYETLADMQNILTGGREMQDTSGIDTGFVGPTAERGGATPDPRARERRGRARSLGAMIRGAVQRDLGEAVARDIGD